MWSVEWSRVAGRWAVSPPVSLSSLSDAQRNNIAVMLTSERRQENAAEQPVTSVPRSCGRWRRNSLHNVIFNTPRDGQLSDTRPLLH